MGSTPARRRALQPGGRVVPDDDRRRHAVLRLRAARREGQVRPLAGPVAWRSLRPAGEPRGADQHRRPGDRAVDLPRRSDADLRRQGPPRREGRVRPVRDLPVRLTVERATSSGSEGELLGLGLRSALLAGREDLLLHQQSQRLAGLAPATARRPGSWRRRSGRQGTGCGTSTRYPPPRSTSAPRAPRRGKTGGGWATLRWGTVSRRRSWW